MSRKKFSPLSLVDTLNTYATQALLDATNSIAQYQRKIIQNELVLRRLVEAKLISGDRYNYSNIRMWEVVEFDKTLNVGKRTKLLAALHSCLGTVKEDGVELVDHKKRIIKVQLKLVDHPDSSVRISYLRKYTKEEEASKPCKIVEVVVAEAQPATPEKKAMRLVCQQP